MRHILNGAIGQSGNKTTFYHCGACDQVVSEKYAINHPKAELDYLFAVEDDDPERKKKSQEQEEKEEKVDDIARAEGEEKKLEEIKKALRKLTSEELDDELFKLQSELHDIKKKLNPDEETKKSKSASRYDVLLLEPYQDNTKSGDELLIRLGSTDDQTKGNAKDDEFLKSLGSVD